MNYLFIPILFCVSFFRYCFPFGRPEGALKATLSLLERVIKNSVGIYAKTILFLCGYIYVDMHIHMEIR